MKRNLAQWLETILALHPTEIDMGLGRIRLVAQRLGIAPNAPVITVAGTNGKGSTVALLNALATAAGKKVGVYTSPHIHRFNERIRLQNHLVEDATLCQAFEAVEAAREEVSLTFFEFTTLAALWIFQRAELDLWILEVGLGGRLDAVNIVDPQVALVTSIALDHTDWLGEELDHIALEKAGIARPHTPLLYGMETVPETVADFAAQHQVLLAVRGKDFGVDNATLWWHQGQQRHGLPLTQDIPLGEDNLAMVLAALAHVDMLPSLASVVHIAARTELAGRSQYFYHKDRHWYLDVGHNPAAIRRFFHRLPSTEIPPLGVCAMLMDKSPLTLSEQAHLARRWYLADLSVPRGGTAQRLSDSLAANVPRECYPSVKEAMQAALAESQAGDTIVVLGSFYTVAEAEAYLSDAVS